MTEPKGPLMLCVTSVLKPPPATIAKIGHSVTLPRPVAVKTLAAGTAGFILLGPIGLLLGGLQGLLIGGAVGAAVGITLIAWEPRKGETLVQILGVSASTKMRQKPVKLDSDTVSVSIGVARISRVNEGRCHILSGAVEVRPGAYDERGVLRDEANSNLLDGLGGREAFPDADVGPDPDDRQEAIYGATTVEEATPDHVGVGGFPPPPPRTGSGLDEQASEGSAVDTDGGWRRPEGAGTHRLPTAPTGPVVLRGHETASLGDTWEDHPEPAVSDNASGAGRGRLRDIVGRIRTDKTSSTAPSADIEAFDDANTAEPMWSDPSDIPNAEATDSQQSTVPSRGAIPPLRPGWAVTNNSPPAVQPTGEEVGGAKASESGAVADSQALSQQLQGLLAARLNRGGGEEGDG